MAAPTEVSEEFPLLIAVAASAAERVRIAELVDGVAPLLMVGSLDELRRIIATEAAEELVSSPPAEGLTIDSARSVARWGGREVRLTRLEVDLLTSLNTEPQRVWTYRELHDAVWQNPARQGTGDIQSLVKRLRHKLRKLGTTVGIDAVRGTGYRLTDRRPAQATST